MEKTADRVPQKGRPKLSDEVRALRGSRVKARVWFLTIPRFDLTPQEAKSILVAKEPRLWRWAIAQEKHGDGANHLHVYLEYQQPQLFYLNRFDYLGKHGKLERVKSYDVILRYLSKDAEPLANFSLRREILKRDFAPGVLSLVKRGDSVDALYRDFGEIAIKKNWSSVRAFLKVTADATKRLEELKKPGLRFISRDMIESSLTTEELALFDDLSFDGYRGLVDEFNKIALNKNKQAYKDCCIAIVGEAGIGKSSLIDKLIDVIPTYRFPADGWHIGYTDHHQDMIVWNQWHLKLDTLRFPDYLNFLEGRPVDLRVKGGKSYKNDCPMIVLISNLSWRDHVDNKFKPTTKPQYNAIATAALACRIKQFNFGNRPLFFIQKLIHPR